MKPVNSVEIKEALAFMLRKFQECCFNCLLMSQIDLSDNH